MVAEKPVVVVVRPEMLYHPEKDMYAARIRALGLTAYGDTCKESVQKVKKMFGLFVKCHRKRGTLEATLKKSGLRWYWEDEYKEELPVEWVSCENKGGQILVCGKTRESSWQAMNSLEFALA